MKRFLLMMTSIMMLAGFTSCRKVCGNVEFYPEKMDIDAKAQTVDVTTSGGLYILSVEEEGKPEISWHYIEECLLEGDWYTLKGEEWWKTFKVTVTENTTGKDRKIRISAMQYDSQGFMTIIQRAQ